MSKNKNNANFFDVFSSEKTLKKVNHSTKDFLRLNEIGVLSGKLLDEYSGRFYFAIVKQDKALSITFVKVTPTTAETLKGLNANQCSITKQGVSTNALFKQAYALFNSKPLKGKTYSYYAFGKNVVKKQDKESFELELPLA